MKKKKCRLPKGKKLPKNYQGIVGVYDDVTPGCALPSYDEAYLTDGIWFQPNLNLDQMPQGVLKYDDWPAYSTCLWELSLTYCLKENK